MGHGGLTDWKVANLFLLFIYNMSWRGSFGQTNNTLDSMRCSKVNGSVGYCPSSFAIGFLPYWIVDNTNTSSSLIQRNQELVFLLSGFLLQLRALCYYNTHSSSFSLSQHELAYVIIRKPRAPNLAFPNMQIGISIVTMVSVQRTSPPHSIGGDGLQYRESSCGVLNEEEHDTASNAEISVNAEGIVTNDYPRRSMIIPSC